MKAPTTKGKRAKSMFIMILCMLLIMVNVLPASVFSAETESVQDSVFKLTDHLTDGKEYLIVSTASGSGYALTNPGGSSSGASMGSTAVAAETGDVDGDGVADAYIAAEDPAIVWTASANGSRFDLTNGSDYLEGKSGDVKIFSSQQYEDRGWTYTGGQLQHEGGNNTYKVYCSAGSFTATYNSTDEQVFLFEKTEIVSGTAEVTGVSLSAETLALRVGETAELTAIVAPANAANKEVTWSSDDDEVAAVSAAVSPTRSASVSSLRETPVTSAVPETTSVFSNRYTCSSVLL